MITGWFPLLCLWAIVLGSITSLALHLLTPWRATVLGRHLLAYIAVTVAWYTLILLGSYAGVPKWLEILQALVFALIPLVIWWRAALQVRARHRPLRRKGD